MTVKPLSEVPCSSSGQPLRIPQEEHKELQREGTENMKGLTRGLSAVWAVGNQKHALCGHFYSHRGLGPLCMPLGLRPLLNTPKEN